MLEEKEKIEGRQILLNLRGNVKTVDKFQKNKKRFFLLSVFLCLVIVALVYFVSNKSNVKSISIENNHYLSDQEVIAISGLSTDSKFLLSFPFKVESRIKNNPFIDDCKVELLDNLGIRITTNEKKIIGYTYEENNTVLILEDDSRINVDKDNMFMIAYAPLIEGFTKEDIKLIEKNMADIDYKTINEISEIHNYVELKYQNVELIMRDGNYIFTSIEGLNVLNNYYNIASSYSANKHLCYYHEDISGNSYTSACPWEVVEEVKDENTKTEEQ